MAIRDRTDVESRSRNSIKTFSNSFSVERRFGNRQPSALAYSLESFIRSGRRGKDGFGTGCFHLLGDCFEAGGPQNATGGVTVQHRNLNQSKAIRKMAVGLVSVTMTLCAEGKEPNFALSAAGPGD